MRFANRLDFGDKAHEVSMTAIRLVQRMKRDNIHIGRRPSGLCGAALLIAARLHEFNRTVEDVVKIVKVHESTLRKRLMEFGETPSSSLTLDEFMTVDLEEEQDPPSFKVARKKDRERLQKIMDESDVGTHLNQLQHEIERQLDERKAKSRRYSKTASVLQGPAGSKDLEAEEADRFASQSTLGVIQDCLSVGEGSSTPPPPPVGLGPSIASMGLLEDNRQTVPEETENQGTGEIDLDDIDDSEIDSYIMTEQEATNKDLLWMKVNAEYLKQLKEKEEKAQRDLEEGKPEKKKRKPTTKKGKGYQGGASSSAGEAVQKMLQEKKMSSKLNYDVLKNLNVDPHTDLVPVTNNLSPVREGKRERIDSISENVDEPTSKIIKTEKAPRVATVVRRGKKVQTATLPVVQSEEPPVEDTITAAPEDAEEAEEYDDMDGDVEDGQPEEGMSISQLLNKHRGGDDNYEDDYDYDDY